jgi:hypothetical protein
VYNTDTSETYNSIDDNNVDGMARRILKLYWYKFTRKQVTASQTMEYRLILTQYVLKIY